MAGMELHMELIWENRGLVRAKIEGREISVGGEAMLGGSPDFIVYAQYLKAWSDGTPLTDEERTKVLDDLVEEADRRGWKFEVLW
jgi:hypothetical protein